MGQTYNSERLQQMLILLWKLDELEKMLPYPQRVAFGDLHFQLWALLNIDDATAAAARLKYEAEKSTNLADACDRIHEMIDELKDQQRRQDLDRLEHILAELAAADEDHTPGGDPDDIDTDVWDLRFLDGEE